MLAPVNKQLTLFVGVKAGAGTGTGGIGEPGPQGPVGETTRSKVNLTPLLLQDQKK